MARQTDKFIDTNALSFDAEIKLMKLLGASEEVINELIEMKATR